MTTDKAAANDRRFKPDDINDAETVWNGAESVMAMLRNARRGFFHCAADGVAFVPLARFAEEFGQSIDDNYPGSGTAFARLATSYWTLRILEGRLRRRYAGVGIQQLLLAVEEPLGKLFFPDDDDLEPADRAILQRTTIEQSGAPIDAEDFLFGNPLLMGNPLA